MISKIIMHTEEISRKWIDRMADAGINVRGIHSKGERCAAEHLKSLIKTMNQPNYRELLDYAVSRGLEVE